MYKSAYADLDSLKIYILSEILLLPDIYIGLIIYQIFYFEI